MHLASYTIAKCGLNLLDTKETLVVFLSAFHGPSIIHLFLYPTRLFTFPC